MNWLASSPLSFQWPDFLWLLLLLPLLVVFYLWLIHRRQSNALRYSQLGLVKQALGAHSRWRRHLPPALFLISIALLLLSVARPLAVVTLPSLQETIMLSIDVSGSMRARDVEPSRLEAAQNAVRTFINEVPRQTRIGIVSFGGTAALVQPPTLSREDALATVDRFYLQRGTATGSGILVSLATLFPDHGIDVTGGLGARDQRREQRDTRQGAALEVIPPADPASKAAFKPVPPGSYNSAAIILLSDGQRTTGPDPIEAAKLAAERGVRIFTVGIGTVDGEVIGFEGWSFRARLDEDALKAVANITQGEYFYAGTAADLKKVYQSLNSKIVLQTRQTEVTAFFSAAAAVLALLAAALSLWWFNRVL